MLRILHVGVLQLQRPAEVRVSHGQRRGERRRREQSVGGNGAVQRERVGRIYGGRSGGQRRKRGGRELTDEAGRAVVGGRKRRVRR